MAGPFIKGRKCDVIWVEVDKMYFIVQRDPNSTIEEHFDFLKLVARGMASAMAGCNATGYRSLDELLEAYTVKQIQDSRDYPLFNSSPINDSKTE